MEKKSDSTHKLTKDRNSTREKPQKVWKVLKEWIYSNKVCEGVILYRVALHCVCSASLFYRTNSICLDFFLVWSPHSLFYYQLLNEKNSDFGRINRLSSVYLHASAISDLFWKLLSLQHLYTNGYIAFLPKQQNVPLLIGHIFRQFLFHYIYIFCFL